MVASTVKFPQASTTPRRPDVASLQPVDAAGQCAPVQESSANPTRRFPGATPGRSSRDLIYCQSVLPWTSRFSYLWIMDPTHGFFAFHERFVAISAVLFHKFPLPFSFFGPSTQQSIDPSNHSVNPSWIHCPLCIH